MKSNDIVADISPSSLIEALRLIAVALPFWKLLVSIMLDD